MVLAMAGTLYPVPVDRPYNWLPYLYLVYILAGTAAFYTTARSRSATE